MLELPEKVIKTGYNCTTCFKRVKCRHGRCKKEKKDPHRTKDGAYNS